MADNYNQKRTDQRTSCLQREQIPIPESVERLREGTFPYSRETVNWF